MKASEKVCGHHDSVERYCVICLNDEVDRNYRSLNGIEQMLTRNGVAITYPLSDAVENLIEKIEELRTVHSNWALMLLARDDVQGRKVLERMIAYYEQHDGKADDFGRLNIVIDASIALGREQ